MSQWFPELDKMKLGMENKRLSSLLCAILDLGPVRLTKAQAEKVWEGRELQMEEHPDGEVTISLKPLLDKERSSKSVENSGEIS